ncbi:YozQ family protein [Aneurinibacillus sp. BA2021]|nr:YozQ family protein [Aneurinibacillus sp. BA2021]
MPNEANRDIQKSSEKMGDRTYKISDYYTASQTSEGLAVTHEQVSDTYMEGTVEATIDDSENAGKDLKVPDTTYAIAKDQERA